MLVIFTPDQFACGVDYAGTSNLVTLLESFPPSWRPFLPRSWYPFVGNPRDSADRADMIARSPLFRADLYYNEKCMMLFGDAKDSLNKLFSASCKSRPRLLWNC